MKQRCQNARKYFVERFCMKENAPFVDVAKRLVDESDGKILFDGTSRESCAEFLLAVKMRQDMRKWG